MTKLNVKVRNIDDDTLYTHKKIQLGSKSIETPSKAISVGKLKPQTGEKIKQGARGVNEVYVQADKEEIREAQKSFDQSFSRLGSSLKKTSEDEFDVVFFNYTSVEELEHEDIEYIADLLYSTSDFVAVPLMPNLLEQVKEDSVGVSSKYFQRYLNIAERFIDIATQINGKPIMGTIPSAPRIFTNKIIDLYIEKNLRAFCFNFNGRTVTAKDQLTDMVTPLMRQIAVEGKEEDVFTYALNAHRGRSQGSDYIPARDFMSFGFGLDVLGDKHVGPSLPPHIFEKLEDSDPTFRLFESNEYYYKNYEYSELREKIPEETGIPESRIINRKSDSYRLATVINAEQQSLETATLQPYIDEYTVVEHIQDKQGVSFDAISSMKSQKSSFEDDQGQSSLSGLDDMIG